MEHYKNLSLENIRYIYPTDEVEKEESWLPIVGYEGLYEVSCLGRIKSLPNYSKSYLKNNTKIFRKERIRRQSLSKGYLQVALTINKRTTTLYPHRLVAYAFNELVYGKNEVNHNDGNKLNNCSWNTIWSTRSENMKHAFRVCGKKPNNPMLGRKGKDHPSSKCVGENNHAYGMTGEKSKLSKKIICIETGIVYHGISEDARQLKLSVGNLSMVLSGGRKSTGGLKFKFIE